MLKGFQILRIGLLIIAVSLILTHSIGLPIAISCFAMGMGCSLSLVGAAKRFAETRRD